MKANELRIGNVTSDGVIQSFWENGVHVGLGKCLRFGDLSPITPTVEFLLNCGFARVRPRSGVLFAFIKDGIRIYVSNSGNFYYKSRVLSGIRDIQNLYFALTGEELITK